jgi:hypothetical protein
MATFPTLERLEATGHLRITPFLSEQADDIDAARTCLDDEFRNRPRHRHGRAN